MPNMHRRATQRLAVVLAAATVTTAFGLPAPAQAAAGYPSLSAASNSTALDDPHCRRSGDDVTCLFNDSEDVTMPSGMATGLVTVRLRGAPGAEGGGLRGGDGGNGGTLRARFLVRAGDDISIVLGRTGGDGAGGNRGIGGRGSPPGGNGGPATAPIFGTAGGGAGGGGATDLLLNQVTLRYGIGGDLRITAPGGGGGGGGGTVYPAGEGGRLPCHGNSAGKQDGSVGGGGGGGGAPSGGGGTGSEGGCAGFFGAGDQSKPLDQHGVDQVSEDFNDRGSGQAELRFAMAPTPPRTPAPGSAGGPTAGRPDLGVTLVVPQVIRTGMKVAAIATVTNHGTAPATHAALRLDLGPALRTDDTRGTGNAEMRTYSLDTLAPGADIQVRVPVQIVRAAAKDPIVINARADGPDANPRDNLAIAYAKVLP